MFVSFFKKIFAYCISYEKERKNKLEPLIDWIRKLLIKKEKSQVVILNLLEDEYINMLNALGNVDILYSFHLTYLLY